MAGADWPGGGPNEAGRKKKMLFNEGREETGPKIQREGGNPGKRILGGTEDGENGNRRTGDWR